VSNRMRPTPALLARDQNEALIGDGADRRVSVLEGYGIWAPTYDSDPNPLLALEARHLVHVLPDLKGKRVLDVACGTGRWLRKLLGWGAHSGVGVDFAPSMLAEASVTPAVHGRLVRADARALPLQDRIADLEVCSFAVGHFHSLDALARELARTAGHGADLFITDLHPVAYDRGWRCSFHYQGSAVEIVHTPHPLKLISAAFESNSFELVSLLEPRLGEPERKFFVESGKTHMLPAAFSLPAVFIYHFRKLKETSSVKKAA
jgi:ubiquinone/menaquinone biosynthesis C-methylase UbiE